MMPVMRWSAGSNLLGYVRRHGDLACVLLAAVGVAHVDHHLLAQPCRCEQFAGGIDIFWRGNWSLCRRAKCTWQSWLPRVSKMAAWPILVIPMKAWGASAA